MAHTPGPWNIKGWYIRAGEILPGATDQPAVCEVSRFGHPKNARDNARLIAAAPDLLAACKAAHWAISRDCPLGGATDEIKRRLETIIAKAESTSP